MPNLRAPAFVAFTLTASLLACSIAVDLDGLTGGVTPDARSESGGGIDAAADGSDAGVVDASQTDGDGDAAKPACTGNVKSAGPKAATLSAASGSGVPWNNRTQALFADGVYSSALVNASSKQTQRLQAYAYGFVVPANATIKGVSVTVVRLGGADIHDLELRLMIAQVPVGEDKKSAAGWSDTMEQKVYGGPSDLWGLTLTPAIVASEGFGVSLAAQYVDTAGNDTAMLDAINVDVTYCE